jgi:hypothetical protein
MGRAPEKIALSPPKQNNWTTAPRFRRQVFGKPILHVHPDLAAAPMQRKSCEQGSFRMGDRKLWLKTSGGTRQRTRHEPE